MGGTSTTTGKSDQTSQLQPYAPAQGALQGILGSIAPLTGNLGVTPQVTNALNQIQANAGGANPYTIPGSAATLSQLAGGANYGAATGMVNNGFNAASSALAPYLAGNALDPSSNPALASEFGAVSQQVQNTVNPMFAAAGRLASPANAQALATGIAQGAAPILQAAAGNQIGAAGALGGLANSTGGILGNLDAGNANIQSQGLNNAATAYNLMNLGPQSAFAAALQQSQLPIQNASALAGILSPIATQFGTQTSSGTTDQSSTMSGAQQFGTIAGGLGNLTKFLWPS